MTNEGLEEPFLEEEELSEEQKHDIEKIFENMMHHQTDFHMQKVVESAKEKLEGEEIGSYPEEVQASFTYLDEFIEKGEESDKKPQDEPTLEERVTYAALQYFLDPWDIIPDSIPNVGLLDDAYALHFGWMELQELEENIVEQLSGNELFHLADRGKRKDLLSDFEATSLRKIGNDWNTRGELSPKQVAFIEVALEKLVADHSLGDSCPDSPCDACRVVEETLS